MPIRKTLFIAFLGVSLISVILLAGMAFVKARAALREQIEHTATAQAEAISVEIDKTLFERLQNAAVWSELDVMQDLQVRDVDKRLSHFLADVHDGYGGVYESLSCIADGRVVSSSDASLIGEAVPNAKSSGGNVVTLSGAPITLDLLARDGAPDVYLRVPIRSAFADAVLGELRLRLAWNTLYDILDQGNNSHRLTAVLDSDGTLIAASSALRSRGLLLSNVLADWRALAGTVSERSGNPAIDSSVIASVAKSKGYAQFPGFGWTTVVMQPVDEALAPVHRMALFFAAFVLLLVPFALFVAALVSRSIARPIVRLTQFARGYVREKILKAPPTSGSGEVRELTDAFVQLVRDIDLSQQNLIRASKLAVVGEMSAVIAHEVRTPLGILRSSAQMLGRESAISADGRELVGFIESETDRLNRLVSAMLDVARPRPSRYEPVDFNELVRKCLSMLGAQIQKKNVQITLGLAARNSMVDCDEEQMTQVLLNLVMNALQIVREKGRIEVTTIDDDQDIVVEIGDDGPGVDERERSKVFEAFFFKREGGIGLGLAIVQQIINSHHGEIDVGESHLGGALFRFRLPRHRRQEA